MDKAVRKAPDLDMGGMLALVKRHPLTTFLILAHLVIVIPGPPSYRASTTNRKKHFLARNQPYASNERDLTVPRLSPSQPSRSGRSPCRYRRATGAVDPSQRRVTSLLLDQRPRSADLLLDLWVPAIGQRSASADRHIQHVGRHNARVAASGDTCLDCPACQSLGLVSAGSGDLQILIIGRAVHGDRSRAADLGSELSRR